MTATPAPENTHSRRRPPLLLLIAIAIAAGIGAGYCFPVWLARVFVTVNSLFSQFLGFIIPLLILGLVAPAIVEIGNRAGKMLVFTVLLAYGATILAGLFSYFTGSTFFPSLIPVDRYIEAETNSVDLSPYFTIEMTPLMSVTSALVLAFTLGLCVARFAPHQSALCEVLTDFRTVIIMVIRSVIVPLLPLYIFGIFLTMTLSGEVGGMLVTFIKVIGIIFVMHVVLLVAQYLIGAAIDRKNPFKCLATMMPAYFTALGTASSAATIPVTLRQAKVMGIDPAVADFTVPLCATIHMSGSTMKITACALALMIAHSMPYDFPMFAGFIAMLGITIVAAPGVPGGAIMASLGLLSSMLGFSEADNALMIALYVAMDSFGTACNVTGDGALALIVDRFFGGCTAPTESR
ncbi:MAG: dicarboxylate/amino acid:cation symporter [Candidatus Amulumruptor sp.]|nr:dicarboxylate/amino acid:cation symporter [Candidatus Amulumruptor sp.]